MVKKKPAAQAKTAENETVKVETKAAEKTTLERCFWKRIQTASVSLQDMSHLQQQRVQSVSLKKQTKFVKNHFVLS